MTLKPWHTKLIGVAFMIPLIVLAIMLILNKALWVYLICGAIFTYLWNCGLKLVKGAALKDVWGRVVNDLEDAKDDIHDAYHRKDEKVNPPKPPATDT